MLVRQGSVFSRPQLLDAVWGRAAESRPRPTCPRISMNVLVIINLIRNALDALTHSDRRELSVTTSLIDGATIEIAVADTGSGLSKEAEANLFAPFVSTKRDGMGLGLSLSRSTQFRCNDGPK